MKLEQPVKKQPLHSNKLKKKGIDEKIADICKCLEPKL